MRALLALTCSCALSVAGCGGKAAKPENPQHAVRDAIASFQQAAQKKDTRTLCTKVLAQDLLNKLKRADLPCEQALKVSFENVANPRIAVKSVQITGDRAVAQVRSSADNEPALDGSLTLIRERSGWKVDSLGTQGP
ncbi:MAG: Rv0361 family membrane protein [Solirubrobacteraceae bacterium]